MDMVRVEREEQLIDREKALGRDATSVFPTEAKKGGMLGLDKEAAREALGAVNFVTETELMAIKAERGERPEDGTMTVNKTLAEVLEENKQAKDDKFQEIWRSMKTGKNRPLDEDELEFMDNIYSEEARHDRERREEEKEELAAFQLARLEAAEASASASAAPTAATRPPARPQATKSTKRKPMFKSIVKKKEAAPTAQEEEEEQLNAKKQKSDSPGSDGGGGAAGLLGLIGDYGSDSE